MTYELLYRVYREYSFFPGVGERECGSIEFADVHSAQEFCESPQKMLEYLGAESGHFEMRGGERPFEWEWLWEMAYDTACDMNRIPLAYRMWRDAIYGREE